MDERGAGGVVHLRGFCCGNKKLVEMKTSVLSICGLVDSVMELPMPLRNMYPLHYGKVAGAGCRWRIKA
jgi:hypothetical protein